MQIQFYASIKRYKNYKDAQKASLGGLVFTPFVETSYFIKLFK